MAGNEFGRSPFDAISLSPADQNELRTLVKTILDANFTRYGQFAGVDPRAWKLSRGKDGMQIYSSRNEPCQALPTNEACEVESLLCIGSVPGTLDDMMHGVLESATSATDASVKDVDTAAVLARIRAPSTLDPFASLGVKWMEFDVRRRSMGTVTNRDYVYVEATGIKCFPSGEPLGYHVMHSIGIGEAHNLPRRVRSKLSICSFFRQVNKTVSIHSLAIVEPMSDLVRQFVLPRVIQTLQSSFKPASLSSVSKVKKFAQTLSHRPSEHETQRLSGFDQHCVTCSKRVGRFVKFASRHATCATCCRPICSACKIEKKQKVLAADIKLTTKKVAFCFPCLTEAMTTNEAQFYCADKPDNAFEPQASANTWAWATKLPTWGSKGGETPIDLTCTK
ncbi:hypothetical protein CCR75_005071 [Bremia lactucae]|uniref:FYVE-type domain-containing protein n=1 Tax=Bremia lactucae TaxID=4779 RepID=A0A976IM52_BRELC|nr:hypothetical protein CCR75_005071 [Bremia lactucae]